jgi:hypothetical protein
VRPEGAWACRSPVLVDLRLVEGQAGSRRTPERALRRHIADLYFDRLYISTLHASVYHIPLQCSAI